MIYLYTGTPGSGKSLDVARKIYSYNLINKPVICNFPINLDRLKKKKNKDLFIYKSDVELSPQFLVDYAKNNLKHGKENQALLVIDEAQRLFNAREWNVPNRRVWCNFFQLHRHFGYNIILVTQFDRLIDRQIRSLVEFEVIHRKVNNFGLVGSLIGLLCMGSIFTRIEYWYGMREKISTTFFRGKKRLYKLYDSYSVDFSLPSYNFSAPIPPDDPFIFGNRQIPVYPPEQKARQINNIIPVKEKQISNDDDLLYTDADLDIKDWQYSEAEVNRLTG